MAKKRQQGFNIAKAMPPRERLMAAAGRLAEAENQRKARKLSSARRLCDDLLRDFPNYVGALHTLGQVYIDLEEFEKAYQVLTKADDLCPDNWHILTSLGWAQCRLGMFDRGLAKLEQAHELNPESGTTLEKLVTALSADEELSKALPLAEKLVALDPAAAKPKSILLSFYAMSNRYTEAAAVARELLSRGQLTPNALYAMCNVPQSFLGFDLLPLLEQFETSDSLEMKVMAFAKAIALDRAGRVDESWKQLQVANQADRDQVIDLLRNSDAEREDVIGRARRHSVFSTPSKCGPDVARTLAIVGASRSGKTMLEGLVASLDGVQRGYENKIIDKALARTFREARCIELSSIIEMPEELNADYSRNYLFELARRAPGARVLTNTVPGQMPQAFRLRTCVPGFKMIVVKRNNRDQLLEIYRRSYASPQTHPYAYDIRTIKEYLDRYYELASICAEKMPHDCLILNYEDIVADPREAVLKVASLCNIDSVPTELPETGDGRGVSEPYAAYIEKALGQS